MGRLTQTLAGRVLLILVLVAIVPLGVVGFAIASLDRYAFTQQSAGELVGLARGLAGDLELYVNEQLNTSRAIAGLPTITSMEPAVQNTVLVELFHAYPEFTRLSVFSPAGEWLTSSRPDGVHTVATRPAFQLAAQRGQQAWEVGPSPSTGRISFLIYTPIREASRHVVGVLSTVVDLVSISASLDGVTSGGGRQAILLGNGGYPLVAPPELGLSDAAHPWQLLPDAVRPAGPGTTTYTLARERWVAGFASVGTVGWTVLVARPEAAVLEPAQRSWHVALAGLSLSVLAAIGAAYLLARQTTRPVRQLARAAQAFGAGELSAPLPPIAGTTGEIATLISAFGDMRDRVVAREAETERSLAQEHEARRLAERAVRARDEFLSIAAHELKTPTTSLRGFAQLTMRRLGREGQVDPAQLRRALEVIDQQAVKLTMLVSQLLDVSRLEAGRVALDRQPTDLGALLTTVIASVQAGAPARAIRLEKPATPAMALVDPLRLEQVLNNLLDNAVRYSPGNTPIDVTLSTFLPATAFASNGQASLPHGAPAAARSAPPAWPGANGVTDAHSATVSAHKVNGVAQPTSSDRWLRIAVRDYGQGIPPGRRERIFEPFYQVHPEHHTTGLGLGLYVARQLTELHGGSLEAAFPPEGGTCFSVTLPALEHNVGAESTSAAASV